MPRIPRRIHPHRATVAYTFASSAAACGGETPCAAAQCFGSVTVRLRPRSTRPVQSLKPVTSQQKPAVTFDRVAPIVSGYGVRKTPHRRSMQPVGVYPGVGSGRCLSAAALRGSASPEAAAPSSSASPSTTTATRTAHRRRAESHPSPFVGPQQCHVAGGPYSNVLAVSPGR